MIRRWLLLLPLPATAQDTLAGRMLEGSWALRAEGATIMRFDLVRQGEGWGGAWTKPTSFRSNGTQFGDIVMPATTRRADRGQAIGVWAEILFDDPREGEPPDQFRFRLVSPDRAEMLYVGTGLPPFILERVTADAPLGPFAEGRVYGAPARPAAASPAAASPATAPPATAPPATAPPAARPAAAPTVSTSAPALPPLAEPASAQPAPSPAPARPQPAPPAVDRPVQGPVENPPAIIGR